MRSLQQLRKTNFGMCICDHYENFIKKNDLVSSCLSTLENETTCFLKALKWVMDERTEPSG